MRYIITPCDMALACHGIDIRDVVKMGSCKEILSYNLLRCSIILNLIDDGGYTGEKIKKILSRETIGHIRCFHHNPTPKNLISVLGMMKEDRESVTPDVNAVRLCTMILNDPTEDKIEHVKKTLKWSDVDIQDLLNMSYILSQQERG